MRRPADVGNSDAHFFPRPRAATGAGAAIGSAIFGARLTGLRTFASPIAVTLFALASAGVLVFAGADAAFAFPPPRTGLERIHEVDDLAAGGDILAARRSNDGLASNLLVDGGEDAAPSLRP